MSATEVTPRLVGWTKSLRGKTVAFGNVPILVGSGNAATCRISDPLASRRHAELVRHPDGSCSVKDLGSRNGTHVNGQKLQPEQTVTLRHGDSVFFAQQGYRFDRGTGLLTNRNLAGRGVVLVVLLLALLAGLRLGCLPSNRPGAVAPPPLSRPTGQ